MKILVVGAGATGGYLGAKLIAGGRDVTFLVRPKRQAQLADRGLEIRTAGGETISTAVRAVDRSRLQERFDVVILAVRRGALDHASDDAAPAVGDTTRIIPLLNGIAHIDSLARRFGRQRVYGASAALAVSLRDGVIVEFVPTANIQIGPLDGTGDDLTTAAADELTVDGLVTAVNDDIVAAMWTKFAFINSTAALTCLLRRPIGPIASTPGGVDTADALLAEVCQIAAAEGHPLDAVRRAQLRGTLTAPESPFAPSMLRDLTDGLPVENEVLVELVDRARRRQLNAPLLTAASVAVDLHNRIAFQGMS